MYFLSDINFNKIQDGEDTHRSFRDHSQNREKGMSFTQLGLG